MVLNLMAFGRVPAWAIALAILAPGSANGQASERRTASEQASADESSRDGWIGIRFDATIGELGAGRFEMLVTEVYRGGPADLAGIQVGDRLIPAGPAAPFSTWIRSVADAGPGHSIRLHRKRAGQETTVVVVAGRRPPDLPPVPVHRYEGARRRIHAATDSMLVAVTVTMDSLLARRGATRWVDTIFDARDWIDTLAALELEFLNALRAGVVQRARIDEPGGDGPPAAGAALFAAVMGGAELRDMTRDLGRHFGTDEGVLVTSVTPASSAASTGFRAGDVVVAAAGTPLATASVLRATLESAPASVRIDVIRNGERIALFYPARTR